MKILVALAKAGSASFEMDGMEKDVCKCFLIIVFSCCGTFERMEMSSVEQVIALTRPCLIYLVAMDEISGLQESNEGHIRQIMLGREKYALLIEIAEKMEKKDVYWEKPDRGRPAENMLSMQSVSKFKDEIHSWNILRSGCGVCYLKCLNCSRLNLLKNFNLVYQKCNLQIIIAHLPSDKCWSTWGKHRTSIIHCN